jgi:DNA-directed RNA polymerase subunit A"
MSEELQKSYSVELPKKIKKEIEETAKELKLNEEQKAKLEEEVRKRYIRGMFEPGEAIGIISAQSISEPATQMCIDYNERIIVKYPEGIRVVKIGEFVDGIFNKFGCKKVENYEVCDLPESITFFVPSLNQNEKIEWKKIKACVRIKSAKQLMKIKTKSGRQIIATGAHSFVVRRENKIVPIVGSKLKIGDRIPAIKYLPEKCNEFLNLNNFFQFTDKKALVKENGFIKQGLTVLPEKIKLDELLGLFLGAYLSEGCCIRERVCISNMNENSILNIKKLAKMFNLRYKEFIHHRGFGWGCDLVISSTLLSSFLIHACNTESENKRVPDFAYSAPEEFVSGLLRGYFDGDGNVSVNRKMIRVHSNSEELIDGIKLLLTRFGIFAYKNKDKKQFSLLIPCKYAPIFLEKIGSDIKENREKLEKLAKLAENFWNKKSQDFNDMIDGFGNIFYIIAKKLKYPTRYINHFTKRQKIGRRTLYRYVKLFEKLAKEKNIDISKELEILKRMLDSDIIWDEIVEISYVKPSSEYVYDISVDGLETFATFDGIITHNTMRTYHFAGAAGIKVTYGLPRLIEIFDAKKEPKTPVMTIFLKKEFNNAEDAKKIAEKIVEKKVSDLMKSVSIDLTEKSIIVELLDKKRMPNVIKKLKESFSNLSVKTKEGKIVITPKKELEIKELQKLRERILDTVISGVSGVLNAVVRKEGNDWIISTLGTNLKEVLELKEIDEKRTYSNDIHEVSAVLGIEAARNVIIKEAFETLQQQGLDVDIRYIMLVADIMTFTGNIRPIGRYGVAGTKTSVLARAAFEETIKHLVRAGIRGEADKFQGIFENVMIGKVVPSGTGMFELIAKLKEKS